MKRANSPSPVAELEEEGSGTIPHGGQQPRPGHLAARDGPHQSDQLVFPRQTSGLVEARTDVGLRSLAQLGTAAGERDRSGLVPARKLPIRSMAFSRLATLLA